MTEECKSEILEERTSFDVIEAKQTKYTITWIIQDFHRCYKNTKPGLCVQSPVFPSTKSKNIQLNILLYPNGINVNSQYFLAVYLSIVSFGDNNEGRADFSVSIVSAGGCSTNGCSKSMPFHSESKILGWPKFIASDTLFIEAKRLLPDLKLKLKLEIEVKEMEFLSGDTSSFKIPELSLSLGDMFDSQKFGDVVFVANGQEIKVYKGILRAHSPVFDAMFEHDMKESEENRVEVTEIDPRVLKEMLRFVHTGETTKLDEMAEDLLAAADKYDLKRLKALCEEFLFSKISVETAASILMISDRYNADQLKSHVIHFMCLHLRAVLDSKGWATLLNEQPKLMNDVLRMYLEENTSSISTVRVHSQASEYNRFCEQEEEVKFENMVTFHNL